VLQARADPKTKEAIIMTPEALAERVLYRDADVLVLDKPAGIAVHRAPGAGFTLDSLLPALAFGLKWPPALAHRLDRDTSGCLVLGRHPQALRRLMALFAAGMVEKTYWAVVEGAPPGLSGVVAQPILKVRRGGSWQMIADPAGQTAVTGWRVLGQGEDAAWLELKPQTGRTHQIRIHCAGLGCPVLGDGTYGARPAVGERLHLHARRIGFRLGPKDPAVDIVAAPPLHMRLALISCGYRVEDTA
jgi:tRNA pseudouridine32 synthase / 23S rRNA pseudouridine746 synthase